MQHKSSIKLAGKILLALVFFPSAALWANHPVLVEGNCLVPGTSSTQVAGTCGDYDGDGRIGVAEDADGVDRVFGTITVALGADGINQNGKIIIVTSGVFAEVVNITGANGNVTLEAAAGVEADIDAVSQGDTSGLGNGGRQNSPGIIVNSPATRYVILRNLEIRNWTTGIQVNGASRVAIEQSRIENNRDYGVEVNGTAKVKIDQSQVLGNGFRSGAAPANNTPNPGKGIAFEEDSSGAIFRTEVSGSFASGIASERRQVKQKDVYLFDNGRDSDDDEEDED